MNKKFKSFCAMLLITGSILNANVSVFAAESNIPTEVSVKNERESIIEPSLSVDLHWEQTSRTFATNKRFVLYKIDESSEYEVSTTSWSSTIKATSAYEAIAKLEASASAGVEYVGLSASVSASGSVTTTVTGEKVYEWVVSGSKSTYRIQYYNLEREVLDIYYIGVFIGTNGVVFETDYTYRFKETILTGVQRRVKGRYVATAPR